MSPAACHWSSAAFATSTLRVSRMHAKPRGTDGVVALADEVASAAGGALMSGQSIRP